MGGLLAECGPFPGDDGQGCAPASPRVMMTPGRTGTSRGWCGSLTRAACSRRRSRPWRARRSRLAWATLADVDPGLLAAMCGPDGLGGQAVSAAFGQGKAADVAAPWTGPRGADRPGGRRRRRP